MEEKIKKGLIGELGDVVVHKPGEALLEPKIREVQIITEVVDGKAKTKIYFLKEDFSQKFIEVETAVEYLETQFGNRYITKIQLTEELINDLKK